MQEDRSTDIAWAAGLFEGEGCVNAYQRPSGKWQVQIRLGMTDRDVVERFASVMQCGAIHTVVNSQHADWKPCHTWVVYEATEVRAVIAILLPHLGERRRTRALGVDEIAATIRSHYAKTTHCPKGHELAGDNLRLEPIKRAGKVYSARRCKTCRQAQERDRARRTKGITPDRYRK